ILPYSNLTLGFFYLSDRL
ncbi:hypothetical protein ANME2D_00225, partial [Candidatus Methanoperedens nitroreducens]